MPSVRRTLLTIGHSNHSIDAFCALLTQHGVTKLADVRSVPYSRFNPHFNQKPLAAELVSRGIGYEFFGRELGGRSEDQSCYEGGRVQYARLAQADTFQEGILRLVSECEQHQVALMCSEKEPLDCHRSLLLGKDLIARGVAVEHIHADGSIETHCAAMERLLKVVGFPYQDLFHTTDELIADAMMVQESRVAYVVDGPMTGASGNRR